MPNHSTEDAAKLALDAAVGRDLAILLLGLTLFSLIAVVATWRFKRALFPIAVGLTALQGVHTYEHLLQVFKWVDQPYQPGYMSYAAQLFAVGYGGLADKLGYTGTALGMEILHLVGNLLFLVGSLALYKVRKNSTSVALLQFETIHVIEHLTLTASAATGRPAWGASTLFAQLSGAELTSYRVWWHLVMNLVGFILAVVALSKPRWSVKPLTVLAITLTLTLAPIIMASTTPPDPGYKELKDILVTYQGLSAALLTPVVLTVLLQLILFQRKKSTNINQSTAIAGSELRDVLK